MIYLLVFFIPFLLFIPLGMKWDLKLKIVIPWTFVNGLLACLSLYCLDKAYPDVLPGIKLLAGLSQTGIITAVVVMMFFFRDPERVSPEQDGVIVSPADGKIIYVKEIERGNFPFAVKGRKEIPLKEFLAEELISDKGVQVGISMNLLNVHVNRSPIGGTIALLRRIPGGFFSLRRISSLLENERVLTVIEGEGVKVGVVQIASRLVRRISPYIKEREKVNIGQRIGMIRFGSQVDILIPMKKELKLQVTPGKEVKAGVSIIASY